MTDSRGAKFRSLYEMLNDRTEIRKSKMLGWIEANDEVRLLWNERFTGAAIIVQVDGIGEGMNARTGISASVGAVIDENDIRHFSETASFLIGVIKFNNVTDAKMKLGFANIATLAGYINAANFAGFNVDTNFSLETDNAGTTSRTSSGIALDTAYHNVEVECQSANILLSMAGDLKVTKSTDRPAARLQIFASIQNGAGGFNSQFQIRYIEATNT